MIWYILYPFRGTTEPPKLSPEHPIRRAFELHGRATARHWLCTILFSVTISVLLCYPAFFHPDSPAATGLRSLPRHVWTTVTEFEGNGNADVEMHQVWVHGDYMKAIDPQVLQQGLYVQNELIADGFDDDKDPALSLNPQWGLDGQGCASNTKGVSWGFHSPLMYWECSQAILAADSDLLATINNRSEQQTFLNFTLRPSSLFAGKAFEKTKLRAADALVITLFDKTNSSHSTLGKTWQLRSKALATNLSPEWSIYPKDGQVVNSRLYEFRFKPMSIYDDLSLALVYFFMTAYVLHRLGGIRAIKSKVGLVIAIFFKMTVSVIASFTVCSFLGINLSHIPREVFPFVVMVFGIGNIFRLLNAILATPSEMPPVQRISTSIGEVGHKSLAKAFQNLALCYILSRFATPWVKPFCAFAAVTLVFDFVFHITFFLAVLSVEVQRMELQDSLARVSNVQLFDKKTKRERKSWLAVLQLGQLPFSTRLAGSAGIASFISALNWHFFDSANQTLSLRGLLYRLLAREPRTSNTPSWSPPPINQARSPAQWLSMQDHNTAKELIDFIKPGAHSFIARVYNPLLIVLNSPDGRKATQKANSLLEKVRHLAHEHAFHAALLVVFTIAGITLLMNYLLWNGAPKNIEDESSKTALFSVKNLPISHSLDIVRLAASGNGHFVSVSLDRSTSVWLYGPGKGYAHTAIRTADMVPKVWPIISSTMDESGILLAICNPEGQIGFFSLATHRFILFPTINLKGQQPLLFSLAWIRSGDQDNLTLFIVTPDGYLTEIEAMTGTRRSRRICLSPITSAMLFACAKGGLSLVFTSKIGLVHILTPLESTQTTSEPVPGFDPRSLDDGQNSGIRSVFGIPGLCLIFLLRGEEVDVVNFQRRALLHTLSIGKMKSNSFRIIHSARRVCSCGAPAVHSLSVVYTDPHTNHMIMQTSTIDDTPTSQICLNSESSRPSQHECKGLDHATVAAHCVNPAGAWETTYAQEVIGVRKSPSLSIHSLTSAAGTSYSTSAANALSKVRARGISRPSPDRHAASDQWEVWSMTASGEFHSRPLLADFIEDDATQRQDAQEELFVAHPGPIARLGQRSVAVAFGNMVKIITLGKEWFEGTAEGNSDQAIASYQWRARRSADRKRH
ncbi:hypothetical protein GQ43DRAFT_397754 [Delitschia confertaspora ATCC 74209]|uniref:SSD domain-containing protein n=1 Tax=Delitschia confertaspora ATCC 74209 TaxID=1513339 RepID=A0A9P4JI56_9PLEO|nr:hypothetical protein GQ43DRAFT_397754 [Delitschia confertaspora ATCC 74209]